MEPATSTADGHGASRTPAGHDAAPNGWPWWVLRGFKNGEVAALTDVYRRHVGDVTGLLRHGFSFASRGRAHRFVGYGSAFELQDALHETFRRAFEPTARLAYDGIRPYAPYLRTIARNVVLRGFRAREVQFPELGAGDDGGDGVGGEAQWADTESATPEDGVARQQVRAVVAAYLDTLKDTDRRLLTLRFIEGSSQRDVAEALGIGRQQVRSREEKLRRGLLVFLRKQGELGLVPGASVVLLAVWASSLPWNDADPIAMSVGRMLRAAGPWGVGL
ncbi:MAG: sigma-70 family RNA polymerase sigma factor [Nannocystaceae bacterium]|nr:sigma-70 family RNA polymerase sigma factor [Nannocystaceae bacterium]